MNKVLMFVVLFFGLLVLDNKAEGPAAIGDATAGKSINKTENSPWDPREEKSASDAQGDEGEPNQTEE